MDKEQAMNEKWYVQGFNACNILVAHAPRSAIFTCHDTLGYGHTKNLFIFNKDYLEYHYSVDDLENIGKEFMKRVDADPNYFDNIISKSREFEKKLDDYMKQFRSISLEGLKEEELIKLMNELFKIDWGQMGYTHILEGISYVCDPMFEKRLRDLLESKKLIGKYKEYFNKLILPTEPSLLKKENLSILEVANYISKNDKETVINNPPETAFKNLSDISLAKLKEHTKNYFWVQMNYFITKPLTETDFISKIKSMLELNPDLDSQLKKDKEAYKKNAEERKKILKELDDDTQLIKLLDITEKNLYWQDDRKRFMLICSWHINMIVKELAKRHNIPHEHAKQLIPEEINKGIEKVDKENLKKRTERCLMFLYRTERGDMKTEIFVGKECDDFIKEFRKKQAEKIDDLRGTCASTGKSSGNVRICRTLKDLRGFEEGEVLVTSMTRPEFLPAMKKAAAVVTDEGGITSHAAIITRELGVPCIIGTKIATKILKNGMLVEVKADHGLVKIINT
jgi:phosphohistidine swiveling domain-containing protein